MIVRNVVARLQELDDVYIQGPVCGITLHRNEPQIALHETQTTYRKHLQLLQTRYANTLRLELSLSIPAVSFISFCSPPLKKNTVVTP